MGLSTAGRSNVSNSGWGLYIDRQTLNQTVSPLMCRMNCSFAERRLRGPTKVTSGSLSVDWILFTACAVRSTCSAVISLFLVWRMKLMNNNPNRPRTIGRIMCSSTTCKICKTIAITAAAIPAIASHSQFRNCLSFMCGLTFCRSAAATARERVAHLEHRRRGCRRLQRPSWAACSPRAARSVFSPFLGRTLLG